MIEDIFLTYANCSLKKNPKNLYKIFEVVDQHLDMAINSRKDIDDIIEHILAFSALNDAKAAEEILRKSEYRYKKSGELEVPWTKGGREYNNLRVAFYSVYGYYKHKFCGDCYPPGGDVRQQFLRNEFAEGSEKPKCYECDQLFFVYMLSEIVAGKKYSEIANLALDVLLTNASKQVEKLILVGPDFSDSPFEERLYEMISWDATMATELVPDRDDLRLSGFNRNLLHSVGYSLTEFLLHKDRRKLKFCLYCKNFFEADDIRQTRCKEEDCRRAYEREKKRKQRDKDPVKYM